MPSFSFGCAARVAAKRGRTAAKPHSSTAALPHGLTASRPHGRTSAWRHGGTAHHRMSAPHGGTHGTVARQHSTAHGCTAAPHVCTSARRHGRAAALRELRARDQRDGARSNRRRVGGSGQRLYTRLRFFPTAKPAARTHSGRPPARHRAPLAAAVRTHASAYPRPLSWVSQHGPRGAQPAYTRCWTASASTVRADRGATGAR